MDGLAPREGQVLIGPLFSEPMRIESVKGNGTGSWALGLVGQASEQFRRVTITAEQLATLTIRDLTLAYNGDASLLRLGIQAYALGIAYEFDPYFGLSISRVDPLPHQLEAVYDYLLKLPQVRFLLADDAGAGKTIMSGLLIRELKLRGLIERILIVCPANLAFQWQRELRDKFDEQFEVLKGCAALRRVKSIWRLCTSTCRLPGSTCMRMFCTINPMLSWLAREIHGPGEAESNSPTSSTSRGYCHRRTACLAQ
jgi:hypothetical protein